MKKYMVLAKQDGKWVHLQLWNDAGEDELDALVSYPVAQEVAEDWTTQHKQECRVVFLVD